MSDDQPNIELYLTDGILMNNFLHFQLVSYYKYYKTNRAFALEIAEDAVREYTKFKALNSIADRDTLDSMETFQAGFKLEIILCKLMTKAAQIKQGLLTEMKDLTIQAFKYRDHSIELIGTFKRLGAFFGLNAFFKISRIFYALAFENIKQTAKMVVADPLEYNNNPLVFEIKYLVKLFMMSGAWCKSTNESSNHIDKIFDDLLKILNITDPFKHIAVVIKTGKEAKQLFDHIKVKIQEHEQEFVSGSPDSQKIQTRILNWKGTIHHQLIKFDSNGKRIEKYAWQSIKYWNLLLDKFYKSRASTVDKNEKTEKCFNNIVERQILNYNAVLKYVSEDLMNKKDVSTDDFKHINQIRGQFIIVNYKMMNFIAIDVPDAKRSYILKQIYYSIAEQLRSIITPTKIFRKQYLKSSILYIKSFRSAQEFLNPKQGLNQMNAEMVTLNILGAMENNVKRFEMEKKLQAQADKADKDYLNKIITKIDSTPFNRRFYQPVDE